jgi:hypothetical protein
VLAKNRKNENIRDLYRGINEFKTSYQLRNKLKKDENGDVSRFPQYFKYTEELIFSVIKCA